MAKEKKSGKNKVIIPWQNEDTSGGGGGTRLPEGDYKVKIVAAKYIRSKDKDTPGIEVKLAVSEGKHKGMQVYDRLWLTPKSLPRLRAVLQLLGIKTGKKAQELDLRKLIGKEIGVSLSDGDPYKNKIKSEVSDYIDTDVVDGDDVDDDDEDEDDEDEDDDDTDDEDDDDDDDDEDLDEVDVDEDL